MTILEKIHRIKYLRLKPEERFLIEILTKVEKGYNVDYPQSTFFSLNGQILFEQDDKNERFWVRYDKIWSVLETKFHINYSDIQELIQNMVWDTLKLKVHTPSAVSLISSSGVWDTLKLKVHTPDVDVDIDADAVWDTLKLKVSTPGSKFMLYLPIGVGHP